jgi:hypothetical protein
LKKISTLKVFRVIALVVWAIGAGVSVNLTLYAGHNNKSGLLVSLFVVWVLSPFAAMLAAHVFFRRRPPLVKVTVYCLMVAIALVSLLAYSNTLNPFAGKPAAVFLIVPLLLWVVTLVAIPVALSRSRKNANGASLG